MTTILHVEDDELLAEAVKDAFEGLGFRGTYVMAPTVANARKLVRDAGRGQPPDLVITDINLPDGTGIDVVRLVRSDPSTTHVPIVILSGDPDTATVNRAYALGANSYVSKGTSGRSIAEIVGNLYEHWLKDALLPHGSTSRTQAALRRGIGLRSRKTALYLRVAEKLGSPDGDFWMDLALREGNLANLLSFLATELGDRELPPELIEAVEAMQRANDAAMTELESHPERLAADTTTYLHTLVANIHAGVTAHVISYLFPAIPTAMTALRDVAASTLEEVASWIEAHCADDDLRSHIAPLRSDAARIRTAGDVHEAAQPAP